MNVVHMDPSVYTLNPLEAVSRLTKAPDFLTNPNSAFATYTVDKIIRASASNSSISAEAAAVIVQAHMGVAMFSQQKETSRLLAGFVYKMMVPDEAVPKGTKFVRRYGITDQREAQQGTYDTVTNGVQSREYSQVFHHTSKVVTMQFGCLLGVTVPSVAEDLIRREFERVSTSWELTRTMEVLKYCASQPTLTDRIAQKTKMSSRAEKLDSVLVMAELMCGMVNLQPESFVCALENARRVLGSDKPEVLIVGDTLFRVISQRSASGHLCSQIVSEDTRITPEFSVYTMANEKGGGGGSYEFTMQQVTRSALGARDLPFTNESCFGDSSIEMKVNYVRLGGGSFDKIPIVHVDGVQMEHGNNSRDTSTEHKAFCNSEGFKWEYFTVGCSAPALNQINPAHVLSTTDSDEVNYKQLAQRSPSVSYLHQYDGAVVCVTLRSLHPAGNPKELFTRQRRENLQREVDSLTRGNPGAIPVEKMARLARDRHWYDKIKNPASVLEFDARNMVVPRPPPSAVAADKVLPERWIVRPRVALFNSSAMNSVDNEIAQIGSELLAHFGDGEHAKQLAVNLTFLEHALHYEQGLESMLALRGKVLDRQTYDALAKSGDWVKGRLFWSWMTDPVCAVHMRQVLLEKETGANITDEERAVLLQLEGLRNSLLGLFRGVVGNRRNSVVASMPAFFADERTEHGYPNSFTLDDADYCNLMYWIVLPILGAGVYCKGNGGEAHVEQKPLTYRKGEFDLTKEFNLSDNVTVGRLTGRCAFSKAAPGEGWHDVSELFEPTASKHKLCTDAGFSETSLITYMWAIRLQKLACVNNGLAKVLLGMHYSTLLTHEVVQAHYDTRYYSGMSYLLFRGVRFTGCGVSLMQQKSALYTLGTEIVCKPTAHNTHQVHTVNQYCESVVIPETLESPGVHIPNLYMKDVRGGDVHINTGGPFDMVVADAFNGFCPESDSASGYRRPYIFTAGRSERLNGTVAPDPMMRVEAYTCMPTLLYPFSSVSREGKPKHANGRHHHRDEVSNHKLFRSALHMVDFDKSVIDHIGDPFKDTVHRVNGEKRSTDIMQPTTGVAFCGTYGIGLTSDKKLMCVSDQTRETLAERLAPRISGTGIFACNPVATTTRLVNPIFNRIFESSRHSRFLQC